jgi:hypothetical protein
VTVPRVAQGVSVAPAGITFGTVPVGTTIREVIEVFDPGSPPRTLTRAVSTDDRVAVQLLPPTGAPDPHGRGVSAGRVEATVRTDRPGEVDAAIELVLDGPGRPLAPVRVSGRVAAPVEVSPSTVVLPVASSLGPINQVVCLCRSTRGQPLNIRVESQPQGVEAEVIPAEGNSAVRRVRIRLLSGSDGTTSGTETSVQLIGTHGGIETRIEIPVVRSSVAQ